LVIGLGLVAVRFFLNTPKSPVQSGPVISPAIITPSAAPQAVDVGLPVRLKIPAIHVDANIERLGLTSDGAMDVTKGPDNVAWYKLGPRPGAIGNAVIAGHFGWSKGVPAVFDNISKLQPGDKLMVENEGGVTATFVVRELRKYNETADAGAVFNTSDGKAHLNLITCAGVWNKAIGRFPERLVVFADLSARQSL